MGRERFSLILIVSSLLVAAGIVSLTLTSKRDGALEDIHERGSSLARVLSGMPYEHLVPPAGTQSPIQVVRHTHGPSSHFAYAIVEDLQGLLLVQTTAPGVVVPAAPLPGESPTSWLGEREIHDPAGGEAYREFYAPVLREGDLVAQIRLGFSHPGFALSPGELSSLGVLALLILLPALLSHYFNHRVLCSLRDAQQQLRPYLPADLAVDGERADISAFIRAFRHFMELAQDRMQSHERERLELIASSRVASYQRTQLESVLRDFPEAVLLIDDQGLVTFANSKIEPLLGVSVDELVGAPTEDWCAQEELRSLILDLASGRRQGGRLEFSSDSAMRQLVTVGNRLGGPEADAGVAAVVLIRDAARETLIRSSQLEFISQVSHELKSPMNVLAMYSETLLDRENQSEEAVRDACNVIYDEVNRLSRLISTLLTVARIESGAVSPTRSRIDLPEFLRDVVHTMERAAQSSGVALEVQVDDDLPPFWGDKDLLRVALNNLLTNAIKYNQAGGSARLSAEVVDDQIALRVRDSGIGIDLEEQPHVFDKFFRSETAEVQKQQGHGLGLALVQEIARIHSGQVELMSNPGEGSTFSLIFDARLMLGEGRTA